MRMFSVAGLITVTCLAGCGERPPAVSDGQQVSRGEEGSRPGEVSRAEFVAEGKTWPLSVDHGQIGCSGRVGTEARWFRAPDGTLYGLNGFATSEAGYADLTPIWLNDETRLKQLQEAFPDRPVTIPVKLSIGDLSNDAAKLC